jgi:hypothetical protein
MSDIDTLIALTRKQREAVAALATSDPDTALLNYSAAAHIKKNSPANPKDVEDGKRYASIVANYQKSLSDLLVDYDTVETAAKAYEKDPSKANSDAVLESAGALEQALDTRHLYLTKATRRTREESPEKHLAQGMRAELGDLGNALEKSLAKNQLRMTNLMRFSPDRRDAKDPAAEAAYQVGYKLEDALAHPVLGAQNPNAPKDVKDALEKSLGAIVTFRDNTTTANYQATKNSLNQAIETTQSNANAALKEELLPKLWDARKLLEESAPTAGGRKASAPTPTKENPAPAAPSAPAAKTTKPPLPFEEPVKTLNGLTTNPDNARWLNMFPPVKNSLSTAKQQAAALQSNPNNDAAATQLMTALHDARHALSKTQGAGQTEIPKEVDALITAFSTTDSRMAAANIEGLAASWLKEGNLGKGPGSVRESMEKVRDAAHSLTESVQTNGSWDPAKKDALIQAIDAVPQTDTTTKMKAELYTSKLVLGTAQEKTESKQADKSLPMKTQTYTQSQIRFP